MKRDSIIAISVFNLGIFKGGHFHSILDENKTLPNISPFTFIILKMAHSSFSKGPFDTERGQAHCNIPLNLFQIFKKKLCIAQSHTFM